MKALRFYAPGDVRLEDVGSDGVLTAQPTLDRARDVRRADLQLAQLVVLDELSAEEGQREAEEDDRDGHRRDGGQDHPATQGQCSPVSKRKPMPRTVEM